MVPDSKIDDLQQQTEGMIQMINHMSTTEKKTQIGERRVYQDDQSHEHPTQRREEQE